jgi:hypothetical protein
MNYCMDQYLYHARELPSVWQVVEVRQFGLRALIMLERRGARPVAPRRSEPRYEVTMTVTGDEASAYLGAGLLFTLWPGGEVGHGTMTRRVFTRGTARPDAVSEAASANTRARAR